MAYDWRRFLPIFFFCVTGHAGEVTVAVAANFAAPMQKVTTLFQAETGHKAVLSLGSTGKFYAQIHNGAPFDVLLAADAETPARLVQEGRGSQRFTYAVGKLVLWSPQPKMIDAQGRVLSTISPQRLSLANPKLAPYGVAAMEVLQATGMLTRWGDHLVQGENIAQAYQFVVTGNAPLGFVALSQVWEDGRLREGSAWLVPAHLYTPIRQDAVLLRRGQDNPAAQALMAYLRSDKVRVVVRSYGYDL